MSFTVTWGQGAWNEDRPRSYQEWVEDTWDEYLVNSDERSVTEVQLDERGLPKDDKND